VARDELGAVRAVLLLVGGGQKDRVAVQPDPGPLEADHGEDLHDADRLHVEAAAAVDEAVGDLAAEGSKGPVARVGGNHVDVMVENDARPPPGAEQARGQVPAPRHRLGDLGGDAVLLEHSGQEGHALRLVPGRIAGVDGEIAAQQLDRLVAERGPVEVVDAHASTGAPVASSGSPAVRRSPSAIARSLVTRGTLFWPPSLPRERIQR
jgi:hypothetical protein